MTSEGRVPSPSDECPQCGVLARSLPCIDWRGEVMTTPHAGRGPVAGRTPSSLMARLGVTEDEVDEVCNDCSHYLDMHGETGCECCTCEVGREEDTDD